MLRTTSVRPSPIALPMSPRVSAVMAMAAGQPGGITDIAALARAFEQYDATAKATATTVANIATEIHTLNEKVAALTIGGVGDGGPANGGAGMARVLNA